MVGVVGLTVGGFLRGMGSLSGMGAISSLMWTLLKPGDGDPTTRAPSRTNG